MRRWKSVPRLPQVGNEEDETAACARAEAEADEQPLDASERLCELKQSVTDAAWSAEEVEASCNLYQRQCERQRQRWQRRQQCRARRQYTSC